MFKRFFQVCPVFFLFLNLYFFIFFSFLTFILLFFLFNSLFQNFFFSDLILLG